MDAIKIISQNVGQTVSRIIENTDERLFENAREIRLFAGRPLRIVNGEEGFFIGRNGRKCEAGSAADRLSLREIRDTFAALCKYSVHTFEREIREGFITIEGGIRVGICGTAVYENGKIINIKDICALNIRIAREIKGAAAEIAEKTGFGEQGGILVAGPPCSGKTTLLRDMARIFGNRGKSVCIVDERMEIAGAYGGVPSFDVGECTAVLNGFYKSDGIISAVRSMAPDVIICDEFGGEDEVAASLYAMKSGVTVAASMHCLDEHDLCSKDEFRVLTEKGVLRWAVFTGRGGKTKSIRKAEDMLK